MVITILNPKGGSGKSTLSTNLARALQKGKKGKRNEVLLIDCDRQGTSLDWSEKGDETLDLPEVIGLTNANLLGKGIHSLMPEYDHIVVDGSAKMDADLTNKIVGFSDLVLMPVRPSAADIWGVFPLVEMVKKSQLTKKGKPLAAFVVSQQIRSTNLAKSIKQAVEGYGIPVLKSRLTMLVSYTEAMALGSTVLDYDPSGSASIEIESLKKEVLSHG